VTDAEHDQQRLRLRSDAVIWREVGDEVTALSLKRSGYLAPSESARELWRMLGAGTTLPELASALERDWVSAMSRRCRMRRSWKSCVDAVCSSRR
jgi:hypothetical protein